MEKLIERWLPTEYISQASHRERQGRFPPLFWIHVWWARRPLIGMRAVIAAALVNADGVDEKRREEFLHAIWLKAPGSRGKMYPGEPERPSYNYAPKTALLEKLARRKLSEVRLLDVFAGGGTIPFEALRLGVGEVVAVEYNPVAYIILKAVLEYPLKYGQRLVKDVEKWARWLLQQLRNELQPYFPRHPRGKPTGYIWVRVYRCPHHGVEIPALATNLSEEWGLRVEYDNSEFKIRVVKGETQKTYQAKGLTCPKGHVLSTEELAKLHAKEMTKWEEGEIGHQPAALAAVKLDTGEYVEPTKEMLEAYQKAAEVVKQHFYEWLGKYIPHQEIPEGDETKRLLKHGFTHFYKLFNARQLLVHATVVRLIKEAYRLISEEAGDPEYAKAVVTYLALAHGKHLDYNSVLTGWHDRESGVILHVFDRHDFHVGQDFGEGELITENAGMDWALFSNTGVVTALRKIVELLSGVSGRVRVVLGDASDSATYSDLGVFDLVVTDPPYYGNVNYAELSDYFYVWLRLSVGDLYPEAFSRELTPKEREIVVNKSRGCDERCFEGRMKAVFESLKYVLKEDGLLVIIYGHRSFEGLRAMFRAAFDAGFRVTALWSFASEMSRSLHLVGKAAVRSNLVVVFRPREGSELCIVKPSLFAEVGEEASRAFAEVYRLGLSLVDALMAANAAAFKVVSKCWPLRTVEGREFRLEELEEVVNKSVARAFSNNVLGGEVDGWSLAYLIARGVYGRPTYDDLRRIGIGAGISHDEFIKRYCGKPSESGGEKVYPVLSLLEIRAAGSGRLVDALAEALRAVKAGGANAGVKKLEELGFRLGPTVCRYVGELLNVAEGEERELLQVLSAKCGEVNKNGALNGGKRNVPLDSFF